MPTLLAATLAIAAVPATAQAVIFRIDSETFKGRIDASLTVKWTRARGPVGARCRDWSSSTGTERVVARSREYSAYRIGRRLIGSGAFRGEGSGSGRTITAFLTEPGCPAVCASAAALPGRPRGRASDCAQADKRADSRWRCVARRAAGVVSLDGAGGRIDALADLRPHYTGPSAVKCGVRPRGKSFRINLGRVSDLRHVGRRGRYIARNSRSGNCPGVERVESDGTRLSCRYTLRVAMNLRRTG